MGGTTMSTPLPGHEDRNSGEGEYEESEHSDEDNYPSSDYEATMSFDDSNYVQEQSCVARIVLVRGCC
jgi:hypothetical protein